MTQLHISVYCTYLATAIPMDTPMELEIPGNVTEIDGKLLLPFSDLIFVLSHSDYLDTISDIALQHFVHVFMNRLYLLGSLQL